MSQGRFSRTMKGERRHAAQRVANRPAIRKEEERPYASPSAQLPAGGASPVTDLGAIENAHTGRKGQFEEPCIRTILFKRRSSGGSCSWSNRHEQIEETYVYGPLRQDSGALGSASSR